MSTIAISVYYLLDIITWAIVIKSVLTWFPNGTNNVVYNLLSTLTYPIEYPIKNVMYKYNSGPIDFSPIISILVLNLLGRVVLMGLM